MGDLRKAMDFVFSFQFWKMGVSWTLALLLSYFQLFLQRIFNPRFSAHQRCKPPTVGARRPVCVITGATSGLGKAAASALSREGYCVVLVARSSQLLSKAIERIKKQNEDADLKAFEVDISSFKSLLNFKASLEKWLSDSNMHSSIQLLVNNAGVLATSPRLTAEGFDQIIGTNYIGPFCLTKLLLPLLRSSPVGSRVVNVTSFTHRSVFKTQVDKETVTQNFLRGPGYPCAYLYEYSKLCLLLFSYELHRQLHSTDESSRISVIAADPGAVETNLMREVPSYVSRLAYSVLKFMGLLQSPEEGISSIIDAALAPVGVSRIYFFGGKGRTLNSSALSYDIRTADKLWKTSCNLFQEFLLASTKTSTSKVDSTSEYNIS